ncbi:hypothetical protein A2U01_0100565, partial [Trifolium medium]|nr:hypothetical protein [Trifolium medium]
MLSSTQPSACPPQLDHELHLQHDQLSSTKSSSFYMLSSTQPSACPAQLDHEL